MIKHQQRGDVLWAKIFGNAADHCAPKGDLDAIHNRFKILLIIWTGFAEVLQDEFAEYKSD